MQGIVFCRFLNPLGGTFPCLWLVNKFLKCTVNKYQKCKVQRSTLKITQNFGNDIQKTSKNLSDYFYACIIEAVSVLRACLTGVFPIHKTLQTTVLTSWFECLCTLLKYKDLFASSKELCLTVLIKRDFVNKRFHLRLTTKLLIFFISTTKDSFDS